MESTEMAVLAATASALAASVSAIAAWFAVHERRRQRRGAHRPELLLTGTRFCLEKAIGSSGPGQVRVVPDSQLTGSGRRLTPHAFLECLNLGTGAAIDIDVQWEYDAQEHLFMITDLVGDGSFAEWLEDGEGLRIRYGGGSESVSDVPAQLRAKIGFIQPARVAAAPTRIELPIVYLAMVGCFLQRADRGQELLAFSGLKQMPIRVVLSYRDIEGHCYSKTFSVHLGLGSWSTSSQDGVRGSGVLEVSG